MNINKHKNEKKFVNYLLIKYSCRILAMSNGNSDNFINQQNQNTMENYKDFDTLLQELKNDIITEDGIIQKNAKRYVISRKVNGTFENITLSQYKNSEDLILVETKKHSFTVTRWDADFTISQQITQNTGR